MLKEQEDLYKLEFRVRDYECDLQGVVNNANYQHYLEHARHEFPISKGISLSRLHDEAIDLIVTKVEIEYKFPLRSTDRFMVTVKMAREGNVRIVFFQEIYRITDEKLIVKAKITTAATRKGKPFFPAGLITEMGLD